MSSRHEYRFGMTFPEFWKAIYQHRNKRRGDLPCGLFSKDHGTCYAECYMKDKCSSYKGNGNSPGGSNIKSAPNDEDVGCFFAELTDPESKSESECVDVRRNSDHHSDWHVNDGDRIHYARIHNLA